MKINKIMYWTATIIIFLFEGVIPAFTSRSELAKAGIRNLGYPDYFGILLMIFKVTGALVLIIPKIPPRVKEWAYAGFAIDFISASVSNTVVYGFGFNAIFPLIIFAILIISYVNYHKINSTPAILS